MESILDRIKKIADNEGVKVTTLESIIGASKGVLSRALNNKTDIQSKWISKIVENYPHYSADWLLTGNGNMIKVKLSSNEEIIGISYKELWLERLELINFQKEKIKNLEEEINKLKKAKESSYSGYRVAEDGPELGK